MAFHDGWHTCLTPQEIAVETVAAFLVGACLGALALLAARS